MTKNEMIKGRLFLLAATIIWGSAFIFQKMGMDHVGPFTFGLFRFCLGALALLPVIWIAEAMQRRKARTASRTGFRDRTLLTGGLLCGVANFVAGSLQQVGLVYTTAGKAGFITSMDIVIVPLLLIIMKRKVSRKIWISVAMACVGLYLLCITESFSLQLGDGLVLGCVIMFAAFLISQLAETKKPLENHEKRDLS